MPDIRARKVEHDIYESRLVRRDTIAYERVDDGGDLVALGFLIPQGIEDGEAEFVAWWDARAGE